METKTCNTCQQTKPLEQFWKGAARCARCVNDWRNAWYKTPEGREHIRRMNLAPARKLGRLRYVAKQRGIEFKLTRAEYESIATDTCHYCQGSVEDFGTGVDRKDNTLGYTVDNLVSSCKWCNAVKNDHYTYEEMLRIGALLQKIREDRQQSTSPATHRANTKPRMIEHR